MNYKNKGIKRSRSAAQFPSMMCERISLYLDFFFRLLAEIELYKSLFVIKENKTITKLDFDFSITVKLHVEYPKAFKCRTFNANNLVVLLCRFIWLFTVSLHFAVRVI